MPYSVPEKVWLYRIVHYLNLEYILLNGIYTRSHPRHDPNYINIGDTSLIAQRNDYPIKIEGCGNLGDYVPFYFGPLSPMLLNIKTGYRGVTKRPQSDIVYICCKLDSILEQNLKFVFTDGHAKDQLSNPYQALNDLNQIDWDIVKSKWWHPIEVDRARQRKKQAEFLIHEYVPASCISAIVVYDQEKTIFVKELIDKSGRTIPVYTNPKEASTSEQLFYY